jgi:hypothetical protein
VGLREVREELLRRYHALQADVGRELEKLYETHFADWRPVAGNDAEHG